MVGLVRQLVTSELLLELQRLAWSLVLSRAEGEGSSPGSGVLLKLG